MPDNDDFIGRNHVLEEMKSLELTTTSKDDFTNLSPRDQHNGQLKSFLNISENAQLQNSKPVIANQDDNRSKNGNQQVKEISNRI